MICLQRTCKLFKLVVEKVPFYLILYFFHLSTKITGLTYLTNWTLYRALLTATHQKSPKENMLGSA